jgi:hypothetical protein
MNNYLPTDYQAFILPAATPAGWMKRTAVRTGVRLSLAT